jgi:hypothetical protein
MGFFFGLIAYLAVIGMIMLGAMTGSIWLTRPLPAAKSEAATTQKSAPQAGAASTRRLNGANVSLTSQRKAGQRRATDKREAKGRHRESRR